MTNYSSNLNFGKPGSLIIDQNYRVFLNYPRPREVMMQPLVKSVYVLFLRHLEGISFYDLKEYETELTEIYRVTSNYAQSKILLDNIDRLTNRQDNSINEKLSRVKVAFNSLLPKSMADQYYIRGMRGKEKRIHLPSDMILWLQKV